MAMTKKKSAHVCRQSGLKRNTPLKSKGWKGRRKRSWPCAEMSTIVWEREHGICEWCGQAVPFGTPAAHLIPKSAVGETSHEPWNLALLCIMAPGCHTRLDSDRAAATREPWLQKRMEQDDRVRVYFERQISRAEYRRETEKD